MKLLLGLSLTCVALLARADETAPSRGELPLWELGALGAAVSQQAYPGSDERVKRAALLPYVIYRGRVLRADGDGAGLRAVKSANFELDLSLAGSLGSGGRALQARQGMARLGTLVEFGPVGRWYVNGREARDRVTVELPMRGVFDAGDQGRHKGFSVEPAVGLSRSGGPAGWGYGLSARVFIGDRRLASTFYAVAPAEALPDRPAYAAQAGLVAWRLNASVGRLLTPDLRMFAFARVDSVAGAANRDSPLVRQTAGAT
ncbi:hypothetical protein DBR42_11635, partial [Pelomonas sp. HMWF004]